jgi:hypothetical protein
MHRVLLAAVLMLSSCSSGQSTATATSYLCAYTFEMTVRSGPSAGFSVSGRFSLVQQADGSYAGGLVDGATQSYYPVTGTVVGDALELRFTTPQGEVMVGRGPRLGDFASSCMSSFEGTLMGPETSDTGDWQSRCCVEPVDPIADAVCQSCINSQGGRPDICKCAVCAYQCPGGGGELQERYGVN